MGKMLRLLLILNLCWALVDLIGINLGWCPEEPERPKPQLLRRFFVSSKQSFSKRHWLKVVIKFCHFFNNAAVFFVRQDS
jgi:hypothetical protein